MSDAFNGFLPIDELVVVGRTGDEVHRLDPEAAAAFLDLAAAYLARFGYPIGITDAYRTFSAQVASRTRYGSYAAKPGTSVHGLGKALDLAGPLRNTQSPEHAWMRDVAPAYGWVWPEWARNVDPIDGQFEPWHWEYIGRPATPQPRNERPPRMILISSPAGEQTVVNVDRLPLIATLAGPDESAALAVILARDPKQVISLDPGQYSAAMSFFRRYH